MMDKSYYISKMQIYGDKVTEKRLVEYLKENYANVEILKSYVEDTTKLIIELKFECENGVKTECSIASLLHHLVSNQFYVYNVHTEKLEKRIKT